MSYFWTVFMIICIVYFSVIPSFKYRIIPIKKLILIPLVFLYLAFDTIKRDFPLTNINIVFVIGGGILGLLFGILISKNIEILVDKEKKSIGMPGGISLLYTFLFIFAVHFVIGFLKSTQPIFFKQFSLFEAIVIILLGFSSSMSFGRSLVLMYRYSSHSGLNYSEDIHNIKI